MAALALSVVIPTYRREQVLLDTVEYLLALEPGADELILVDQTEVHEPGIQRSLEAMTAAGRIRWVRLAEPSIPAAMNRGLLESRNQLVLFLDDDIRPDPGLFEGHVRAHAEHAGALVAGRVIQPWEEGVELPSDAPFRFCGLEGSWIEEFMGGNFSLPREDALALGGFDENFVRVAYRFEAEFAERWRGSGRRIRFSPQACLHHLKCEGGTRSFGDFLTTWRPHHAVGAYYFLLRTRGLRALPAMLARLWGSVATRHHLRRPWWIPVTLVAETSGLAWACKLAFQGPKLASRDQRT